MSESLPILNFHDAAQVRLLGARVISPITSVSEASYSINRLGSSQLAVHRPVGARNAR